MGLLKLNSRTMIVTRQFLNSLLRGATFDFSKCRTNDEWWRLYRLYLQSPQWRRKREARLILDRHRCVKCNAMRRLEVHHLSYRNVGNEPMDDLRTLCKDCHDGVTEKSRGHK